MIIEQLVRMQIVKVCRKHLPCCSYVQEIFSGLGQTAEEHLSKSFEIIDDNMVVEKDIFFHTMCEHHFLPFYGEGSHLLTYQTDVLQVYLNLPVRLKLC